MAASPVMDHVFPAAVRPGTTNAVTLVGKWDPWPPRFWIDGSGVALEATTNSGQVTVIVTPEAPSGPRFIRAFNDDGVSAPRFLIITPDSQTAEVEPNDQWKSPQRIESLPATVNGRFEKGGDVDSFAVPLRAGQTLVAWLEGYTLMSPLDPVLRILDSKGLQVAWNHDEVRSLDPFLAWTAPADGDYVVQTLGFNYPADSDIRFTGNARCVYRLHLRGGPVAAYALPLGVRRGTATSLRVFGWNLPDGTNTVVSFDGTALGPEVDTVEFLPPGTGRTLTLAVGNGPEWTETEPNSTRETAQSIEVPSAITGDLNAAGDEDRFTFRATQGQALVLEVQAAALGFPLDAWLRIEDSAGKELAQNDDAQGPDPRLDWSAPADGIYTAVVGNRLRRGGNDQRYRFHIRPAVPFLRATVADSAFTLAPGKTNEIKVTLSRQNGYAVPLTLSATGLPDGVRAEPVEISDKVGEASLQLVASTNAPPFGGPIQLRLVEKESGRERSVPHSLVSVGENNGVPQGYRRLVRETLSQLWLTVLRPPPQ